MGRLWFSAVLCGLRFAAGSGSQLCWFSAGSGSQLCWFSAGSGSQRAPVSLVRAPVRGGASGPGACRIRSCGLACSKKAVWVKREG